MKTKLWVLIFSIFIGSAVMQNCYAQDITTTFNQGLAYYDAGNYTLAIEQYNKVLQSNPKDEKTLYNRGLAYFKLTNYESAIKDYTDAILIDLKYENAYFNRGLAYYYQGNYSFAIIDFMPPWI